MEILLQILFVLLLVLLNAYFVASEFALVAVRKTRIDELVKKGIPAAKLVQKALADLDSFISATQLGITIASLALGWIGEPAIAYFIEPLLIFLPENIAFISAHTLAVIIAFSIITFLHIVIGELAPKTIALQKSEITSLIIISPLIIFTRVFKPFIWFLNKSGGLVLKLLGFKPPSGDQIVHSEEEIKIILAQSADRGEIEKKEAEMIYKLFKFADIPVQQIMIPRTEVIAFDVNLKIKDVIEIIKKNQFSRFPVYEKSIDNIIGFVHVKDIYKIVLKEVSNEKLINIGIIREIITVPESKRADEVLFEMRKKRIHIAVVDDEYGGTSGIVTLEDIIESIVGEIQDEFEKPLNDIQKQKDGSYLVNGLVAVDFLLKKFKLPLKGQGYISIGGLVFGLLGRAPRINDKVQIGNISFEVKELEGRRIKIIQLKKEI